MRTALLSASLLISLVVPAAAAPASSAAAAKPTEAPPVVMPARGMTHWLKRGASTMLGALITEILLPTHALYMAGGSAWHDARDAQR